MKKAIFILALAATMVLAGCGNSGSQSSAASEASIASEAPVVAESTTGGNTLTMATEAGFRPYEYYEGTEIVGVDVDIAKEIAAAMGKELVVEHMEFGSIIPAVNSGKADFGAAGMSITEERKQQVDFSIEYATSKQVILTKKDSAIMTDEDLNGKIVGVQLGTVADIVLSDDYPEVHVESYNKYLECTNDLINGRIDAIVLDVLPAQEMVKLDESLIIRDKELFTDVYAFCVKKGNTEMLNTINEVMQRLMDEGKIVEFTAKHSSN